MKVTVNREADGTFSVTYDNGTRLRTGFATNADAWRWADRLDDDALAAEDRRRRIQTSFAER